MAARCGSYEAEAHSAAGDRAPGRQLLGLRAHGAPHGPGGSGVSCGLQGVAPGAVITHVSLISAGRSSTNLGSPQPQRNWQTSSEKWLLLNVRRSHEPGLMRRLGLLMLNVVRI